MRDRVRPSVSSLHDISAHSRMYSSFLWLSAAFSLLQNGWTPLLKCILLSNHANAEVLLLHGADANAEVDLHAFNGLQAAFIYSDGKMVVLLLKYGGFIEVDAKRYQQYIENREIIIERGMLKESDIPKRSFMGKILPFVEQDHALEQERAQYAIVQPTATETTQQSIPSHVYSQEPQHNEQQERRYHTNAQHTPQSETLVQVAKEDWLFPDHTFKVDL
jgi:hypothetical protein